MVGALACHLSLAIVGQIFLIDLYALLAVQYGATIGPDFYTTTSVRGVRSFGAICILSLAGIWLIKLNFLLFFYRIGHHMRAYRIAWGVAVVFCIGCGAACFGQIQYECMFGDLEMRFVTCTTAAYTKASYISVIMTAVIDILSDCASKSSLTRPKSRLQGTHSNKSSLVLCFPVFILWKVQISLRKKLVLGAVFGLVGITMAVTIVRGSIFSPQYKSISDGSREEVNISSVAFWFFVEFTVCEFKPFTRN